MTTMNEKEVSGIIHQVSLPVDDPYYISKETAVSKILSLLTPEPCQEDEGASERIINRGYELIEETDELITITHRGLCKAIDEALSKLRGELNSQMELQKGLVAASTANAIHRKSDEIISTLKVDKAELLAKITELEARLKEKGGV